MHLQYACCHCPNTVAMLGTRPLTHSCLCLPQTLSFYFPPCGKIPPPVIMVQNVSFKYSDNTVSGVSGAALTELTSHRRAPLSLTPILVLVASPPAAHLQKPGVWYRLGYASGSGGPQRSREVHPAEAADGRGTTAGYCIPVTTKSGCMEVFMCVFLVCVCSSCPVTA